MKKITILCLMMLVVSTAFSQMIKGGGRIFSDTSELSKFIDSLYQSGSFSGTVAISKNNSIMYRHSAGFSEKEAKVPITEETVFNIGSVTKMFTAVAIMQLVEAGKIKLTDPVVKHLPAYPNKEWAEKATIQHLLTHTSGMGSFFPHDHNFKDLFNLAEILDTIAKIVSTHDPSEKMEYSNAGFYLLGRIIEKVCGQSYFDYIQKNIFDIAGMRSTYFKFNSHDKKFARGYILNESTGQYETNEKKINRIGGPAGGVLTTVPDLLKFQQALKNDKLLSKTSFLTMTELKVKGDRGMGYGLGIGVGTSPNGSKWIGHNGGGAGIAANFAWFTESDYSVFVLMNQDAKTNMSLMMRSQMFVSGIK